MAASTACDSLPSSPGALASALLDDHHPLFLPSSDFLDPAATAAQEPTPPSPAASARKPPRKRPRASRRQATTVVATDASNFRSMVQEFTGFPAPPHLGPIQLPRPSPLKLAAAPTCTASNTGQSMFADSNVNPTAAALAPSSRSELYSGLAGDGSQAAEDERVSHGHGLFLSFLHAGDRYRSH